MLEKQPFTLCSLVQPYMHSLHSIFTLMDCLYDLQLATRDHSWPKSAAKDSDCQFDDDFI